MDCRIDVAHQAGYSIVHVAGRLTDEQVPDLLRVCAKLGPIRLDLADLDSANLVGVEALRHLRNEGAEIVGATPFIQLLLNGSRSRT